MLIHIFIKMTSTNPITEMPVKNADIESGLTSTPNTHAIVYENAEENGCLIGCASITTFLYLGMYIAFIVCNSLAIQVQGCETTNPRAPLAVKVWLAIDLGFLVILLANSLLASFLAVCNPDCFIVQLGLNMIFHPLVMIVSLTLTICAAVTFWAYMSKNDCTGWVYKYIFAYLIMNFLGIKIATKIYSDKKE